MRKFVLPAIKCAIHKPEVRHFISCGTAKIEILNYMTFLLYRWLILYRNYFSNNHVILCPGQHHIYYHLRTKWILIFTNFCSHMFYDWSLSMRSLSSPNSHLRAFSFSSGYIKCTAWLDLQRSWRGSIEGSKSWEFEPDSYRENRAKKPRFKKRNQLQRMFKKGTYVYGSDWVVILVSIYLTGEECFKHADWLARKWLASTSHLQAAEETNCAWTI